MNMDGTHNAIYAPLLLYNLLIEHVKRFCTKNFGGSEILYEFFGGSQILRNRENEISNPPRKSPPPVVLNEASLMIFGKFTPFGSEKLDVGELESSISP